MKKLVTMAPRSYPDRATLSASWIEAARHWADVYGSMPVYRRDYTKDWAEVGPCDLLLQACRARCIELLNLEDALPGDILLFRIRPEAMAKHVGIYSGANQMIHAAERQCVSKVNLHTCWHRLLVGDFAPPLHSDN